MQNNQKVTQVLGKCNKHGHSAYQTLHGFGFLCRFCGIILNYTPWPDGYDINSVPEWNTKPEKLLEQITKRRLSND